MTYGDGGGFNRGRGGFRRFDSGPREMHKITCSECGKEAEVPFKPREGSPVYCRDCFFKKKGITPREPFKPREETTKKVESEEAEDDGSDDSEEEF